jgi:hypothetical protein
MDVVLLAPVVSHLLTELFTFILRTLPLFYTYSFYSLHAEELLEVPISDYNDIDRGISTSSTVEGHMVHAFLGFFLTMLHQQQLQLQNTAWL